MSEEMSRVATTAFRMYQGKRPSKTETADVIKALIEGTGGQAPTEAQLATLYAHHTPALPAKPKGVDAYISRAMGKKDVRPYLNASYSDGSRLAATDGHRVHFAEDVNWAEGFYDKKGTCIGGVGKFPDIRRVIPKYHSRDNITDINDLENLSIEAEVDGARAVLDLHDGSKVRLRLSYLRDATNGVSAVEIYGQNKHSSVLFIGCVNGSVTHAIVMPIRVD